MKLNQTVVTVVAMAVVGAITFLNSARVPVSSGDSVANYSGNISAQDIEAARAARESRQVSLPDGKDMLIDVVNQQTKIVTESPFEDPLLEYKVRLPNGWQQSELARYIIPGHENDYDVLTTAAKFVGEPIKEKRPYFELQALTLDHGIATSDFATLYFRDHAISPEVVNFLEERLVDALYVEIDDQNDPYAVRVRFERRGNVMTMAKIAYPMGAYKEYAQWMGLFINSFELMNKTQAEIEELDVYKFMNIVRFSYPKSWEVKATKNYSALETQLAVRPKYNASAFEGLILMRIIKRSNREKIDNLLKENLNILERKGFKVIEEGERHDIDIKAKKYPVSFEKEYLVRLIPPTEQEREVFDVVLDETLNPELSMYQSVIDTGKFIILSTLLTPKKEDVYQLWALNRYAYSALVQSVHIRDSY